MITKNNHLLVTIVFIIALLIVGGMILSLIFQSRFGDSRTKRNENEIYLEDDESDVFSPESEEVNLGPSTNTNSNLSLDTPSTDTADNAQSFEDDFSSTLSSYWTATKGKWTVKDGGLTTSPASGHQYLFLTGTGHTYDDFLLSVDVRVLKLSYHHPAVTFRAKDANNHYILRVNQWDTAAQDSLQLYVKSFAGSPQLTDTGWTLLDGQRFHTFMDADALKEDIWYTMKVQAEGRKLRAKIWERETQEPEEWIISVLDSTYTEGAVGLEYYNDAHQFDNFSVTPL